MRCKKCDRTIDRDYYGYVTNRGELICGECSRKDKNSFDLDIQIKQLRELRR